MASAPCFIAHLDMDAFYASVELLRYPELRGRPVVIGGGSRHQPETVVDPESGTTVRKFATLRGYSGRGVATTATYEARALGLHSAMPLRRAAALAPDTVLLPNDFDEYRRHSRLFKAAVRTVATTIEDRGIDEMYLDLTGVEPPPDATRAREPDPVVTDLRVSDDEREAWIRAYAVARAIKRAVRAASGLTCSIGIAPNKLLAKIASELDKPDGLTLLPLSALEARVWPLPVRKINGVGPKSALKLEGFGIRTVGELAAQDPAWLIERFGPHYGAWLADASHGRDDRAIVTYSEPKTMSRETTFERDLSPKLDRDELARVFTGLCVEVADDLHRHGYVAKTIGLKLRFDNFKTVTRVQTIETPTDDAQTIRRTAGECLKRVALDRRIRLLGVRVDNLTNSSEPAIKPNDTAPEPSLW
jgi:DNA polymerase-4